MKEIDNRCLLAIVFALTFAFGLIHPAPTFAQTGGNTSLTGRVKDPEGASLPGATVMLYARERKFSLSTNTDATGTYRFERLAPGEYMVEAEAEDFASASAKQLVVERGRTTTFDIPL